MKYTKSNLRSNKTPLLRRLQRKVDKQNEEKEEDNLDIKNIKRPKNRGKSIRGFQKEKDNIFSVLPKRNTRLGLYNKRGNREW